MVVPARWPHIGPLGRLHLGIRKELLRSRGSRYRTAHLSRNGQNREEIILLKLNSHLIPGLDEVFQEVAALKANHKAEAAASVEAQNAAAAEVIVV